MNAKFKNSSLLVVALATTLAGCGGAGAPSTAIIETQLAQSYTVKLVESPVPGTSIDFRFVSPNGTIAGEYGDGNNHTICFTYKNGVRKDRTPHDGEYAISGVTDSGTIEGEYFNGSEDMPYTTAGGLHVLQLPPNISGWCAGRDANGNGYVTFEDSNNVNTAYREVGGVFTPLTIVGATSIGLSRTSSGGNVVGWANGGGVDGFYLFAPNTTNGVKILNKGEVASVQAVNDLGTVGGYRSEGGSQLAFVQLNGQLQTLPNLGGTYCATNGINAGNIAVGYSGATPGGPYVAFGWTEAQGTVDLNTRIPATPGLSLQIAHGVDNLGRIIGRGSLNGKQVGFILTPVK